MLADFDSDPLATVKLNLVLKYYVQISLFSYQWIWQDPLQKQLKDDNYERLLGIFVLFLIDI